MTLTDAYAVQRRWAASRGRARIGYKVAMTTPATQRSLRTDRPGYGILLDDMLFAEGAEVPAGLFIRPRIELELAFVMRETPPPGCTVEQVLAAVDHVSPAFEIVDSRCELSDAPTGIARGALDIIADGGATAGLMVSGRRYDPRALDLGRIGATLEHDGAIEDSGLFAIVMGAPERAVHWLASTLAEEGDPLRAGDIILCGSAIKGYAAAPGDRFTADFGTLGTLSIRFGPSR
jgi:2-oxo-hept-3-ene-1,7-dioate hydratase